MGGAPYFLIRSAITRAERRTPLAQLDDLQKRLIYHIADDTSQGIEVRMTQLRTHREFGTGPTLLTRLNRMIESGLIARMPDPDDGRSHLLTLTPKARRAIERVSREVERLAITLRGEPAGPQPPARQSSSQGRRRLQG